MININEFKEFKFEKMNSEQKYAILVILLYITKIRTTPKFIKFNHFLKVRFISLRNFKIKVLY